MSSPSSGLLKVPLEVIAENSPEEASSLGVEGFDEEISDLTPGYRDRERERLRGAVRELKKRLAAETDAKVRQDLVIMIRSAEIDVEESTLSEKLMLPYFSVSRSVFFSMRGLLDERVKPERRQAALVRLRRYAGLEDGYEPMAKLVEREIREGLKNPVLLAPFRDGWSAISPRRPICWRGSRRGSTSSA